MSEEDLDHSLGHDRSYGVSLLEHLSVPALQAGHLLHQMPPMLLQRITLPLFYLGQTKNARKERTESTEKREREAAGKWIRWEQWSDCYYDSIVGR